MKRKQIVMMIMVGMSVLTLTACNGKNNGEMVASIGQQEGVVYDDKEQKFGTITQVVGNEITLDLCEVPEFMQQPEVEETEAEGSGGQVMQAQLTMAAQTVGGDENIEIPNIDKNEPIFEVNLTGEQGEFVIGAGVKFIDDTGKGRTSLTDMKEGQTIGVDIVDGKVVSVYFMS